MIFVKDVITARKNPTVMRACALLDKKGREDQSVFLAEGVKLFCEAVNSSLPIECVFVREDKTSEFFPLIERIMTGEKYDNAKIYTLSSGCFEKISTEKSPQGIIVIIKYLDFFKSCNKILEENFSSDDGKSSIILSSMRDPGNVGAVIRSALAFGAQRIIMSSDCADIYNPKTIRASMGCIFKLEILISDDLCRTVKALRHAGRRVFAAELRENAISLDESGIGKSDIVIIGNEGHGLDEALSRECDGSIFIPISSGAESLNAAVAAAIFMREQNK